MGDRFLGQPVTDDQKIRLDDGEESILARELKLFIQESVKEAVDNAMDDHCRLKISDEVAEEIPDLLNTIKHIGDGDLNRGAARIQENHRLMNRLRKTSDRLAISISNFILLALTGGLLSALWLGIKFLVKQE